MHLQLKETSGQEALTIYATTNSKTDLKYFLKNLQLGNFPSGPVVKTLPSNVGDAGLIPGGRSKIPYTAEQLSLHAKITEAHALLHSQYITRKITHDTTKILFVATRRGAAK